MSKIDFWFVNRRDRGATGQQRGTDAHAGKPLLLH
jgi:hypothetical protein